MFACLHANMFCSLSRRFILLHAELFSQMTQIFPELSPCLPHTPWARSFFPLPFPSAVTVGSGCVGQILLLSFTFPSGVPPDLESGVKKCPNLFRLCGFAIRSKGECFPFLLCWGITNPPVLIGRTFFYGGFAIISG